MHRQLRFRFPPWCRTDYVLRLHLSLCQQRACPLWWKPNDWRHPQSSPRLTAPVLPGNFRQPSPPHDRAALPLVRPRPCVQFRAINGRVKSPVWNFFPKGIPPEYQNSRYILRITNDVRSPSLLFRQGQAAYSHRRPPPLTPPPFVHPLLQRPHPITPVHAPCRRLHSHLHQPAA